MITSKLTVPPGIEPNTFLLEPCHVDGEEIRFQEAVGRGLGTDTVECCNDGLSVLQFEEHLLVEQRLLLLLVLLGGRDRPFIGRGAATEPTNVGIRAGLGNGVADPSAVSLAANLRGKILPCRGRRWREIPSCGRLAARS